MPAARALLLTHQPEARRQAARRGHARARTGARHAASLRAAARGLSDADPWVRYYACQALGRLGREAAEHTDAIVGAARPTRPGQVRVAAIEALSHLPGEVALAALRRAARADDPDVRRAALLGLGLAQGHGLAAGVAGRGRRATTRRRA